MKRLRFLINFPEKLLEDSKIAIFKEFFIER